MSDDYISVLKYRCNKCNRLHMHEEKAEACARSHRIEELVSKIEKREHIAQKDLMSKLLDYVKEINGCDECGQMSLHGTKFDMWKEKRFTQYDRGQAMVEIAYALQEDDPEQSLKKAMSFLMPRNFEDVDFLEDREKEVIKSSLRDEEEETEATITQK